MSKYYKCTIKKSRKLKKLSLIKVTAKHNVF